MNRSILFLTVLTALLFLAKHPKAQTSKAVIQGTVNDSLKHTVLPFASITLKNQKEGNSKTIQTDAEGRFKINDLKDGIYNLSVKYIGYRPAILDSIDVSSGKGLVVNFALLLENTLLKGVTVSAVKSPITIKADRIIINVAASPLAAGGNALEVISRAPGVISQGSTLQVRSKIAVVLIDGRYTNLKGDDLANYLSAMPASSIGRIEVISNPSAKYDAQGAAVINIISAKNKMLGTNGSITTGAGFGHYAQYQGGIVLSSNTQKTNIYGSYDYQYVQQYAKTLMNRTLSAAQSIDQDEFARTSRDNNSVKLGLDYTINKNSSFGVLFKGLLNERSRNISNQAQARSGVFTDSSSSVATIGKTRFTNPALNFFYKLKIDTTGKMLNVTADYFRYNSRRGNNYITNYFDRENNSYRAPYLLRDNSPGNNAITSFAADYTIPFYGGELSAGIKSTFTKTDNDILWQQQLNGNWLTDFSKTNHFIYTENINAVYATFNKTIKKLDVQAGLRAEQTNTNGNSVTLNQVDKNSYFNLFPNVSLGYHLSPKHQIGLGYSKKIDRFNFDVVNPFVIYRSQYSYSQGNPDIKPSIYHTMDASYSYNDEFFISADYSIWKNVLADIYKRDPNSNAAISTFANLNSARSADLTISNSKSLFNSKWTSVNTLGGLYAQFNSGDAGLNNAGYSAYINSDNTVQIMSGLKAEVYVSYFSPLAYGAFQIKSRFQTDAGLTKTLFKKAGSLSLNVSDVFNTLRNRFDVQSYGVQLTNNTKTESRFIKMVFTYKFGNQNAKATRNRRTGIENEKNRMSGN